MAIRSPLIPAVVIALGLLAGFVQPATAAVFFSVTPSSVSNTYNGDITLQMTGLMNQETVVVRKFLDLNANGTIDGADMLVQEFKFTDNQAGMVIGGVTNLNVPGDVNASSGVITAALHFQDGDFLQRIIGKYQYELSSPANHFAPITRPLSVTGAPFPQGITGNVISNHTSATVPYAVVILAEPPRADDDGPGRPLLGVIADSAGKYSARLPPGTYRPLLFGRGYVFGFGDSPSLALSPGQTLATNLSLNHAQQSISGQVTEDGNGAVTLPGVWLFGLSTAEGLLAITSADGNGNFKLDVTPGPWQLGALYPVIATHGYVGWDESPKVEASAGATGISVTFPKATALVYGRVKDDLGNPVSGVVIQSTDPDKIYYTESYTDIRGNYAVGALGGLHSGPWEIEVGEESSPTNYVYSYPVLGGLNLSTDQAVRVDFVALRATNHISGWLRDDGGRPIPRVGIYANATIDGTLFYVHPVRTDAQGNYSFNVGDGDWDIEGAVDLPDVYDWPGGERVVIAKNDAVVNFTATVRFTFGSPSLLANQFGFTIIGADGVVVVVDAASDLTFPDWSPVSTNTLIGGSSDFLDPHWTEYPQRFYRLRTP